MVDDLDVTIQRTAHSPIVYEFKDFCCGIVTPDFRLLSQSKYNIPIYIADLGRLIEDAVQTIGPENIESGDIFLNNYTAVSGSHLNNMSVGTPIFDDGHVVSYLAIRVHWPDVGGLVPGSISGNARSILHEGVQYRGIKIASRGRLLPEVVATIRANSWLPDLVVGDLMSNVAACNLGVRRWHEQVRRRWTREQISVLSTEQFEASAQFAREKVSELPDGVYGARARWTAPAREDRLRCG